MKICPIILSGGSGTRLWPLSRTLFPKQFLNLVSEQSLFVETVSRVSGLVLETLPPLVVCNEAHRFLVAQQLQEGGFNHSGILLEPCGKNTAPAIMLAAAYLKKHHAKDVLMLVLPADHVIKSVEVFHSAVAKAMSSASAGSLCTFGIIPTHPHTGYGYIQSAEVAIANQSCVMPVESFVEKPDQKTAEGYITKGCYLWNSGMFLFSIESYSKALQQTASAMYNGCVAAMEKAEQDRDFVRPDRQLFEQCPANSIDYAVMEKAIGLGVPVQVVPMEAGWSDVGSWNSLFDVIPKDEQGNGMRGDVVAVDSQNCLLHSSHGLIATVGLNDMLVVNTADAVLVGPLSESERVKEVVEQLKLQGREESSLHREVHRPWGTYDSIDESATFKVKHIKVLPGAKLSLQLHHQRTEHWVVVSGVATVTRGDEVFTVNVNESTYIPLETKHSLANNSHELLEIIEVQSGSYLGEDDIVRFKDQYGRVNKKGETYS
jgi:mannose-1-phosphate guanylyltransferase/mannose-6-phosphate isomerase